MNHLLLVLALFQQGSLLDQARQQIAAENAVPVVVPADPTWNYTPAPEPVAAAPRLPIFKAYTSDGWDCPWCDVLRNALKNSTIPADSIEWIEVPRSFILPGGVRYSGRVPAIFGPDGRTPVGTNWQSVVRSLETTHATAIQTWSSPLSGTAQGRATFTIKDGKTSDLWRALDKHLVASSGEPMVGGVFDIEVDGPDWIPDLVSGLLTSRQYSRDGLTVTLPPDCTVSLNDNVLSFGRGLIIRKDITKRIRIDAELHAVTISRDGKQYELDLRGTGRLGVPDLTIIIR